MPWISILVALASAVGIYFLPDFHYWFLAILLLNLLVSLVFSKRYSPGALTICRLLVGALFIFSSFTKGVDPLGTKYKMLDYLAVYGMTWLNDFALILAMLMILAEFIPQDQMIRYRMILIRRRRLTMEQTTLGSLMIVKNR